MILSFYFLEEKVCLNLIGSQVKQGAEKMLREHENSGNKAVINDTEQMLADSKQKIVVLQVCKI